MPRTNLTAQFNPEQRAQWKPKIVARNTFKYTRDGETVIRLHATDIVRKLPDGSVILHSGGWQTVTTKERMNAQLPSGFCLTQEKGIWYIAQGWRDTNRVPYFDGMQIPRDYNKPKSKGEATAAKQDRLRAQIRKFVCDVPLDSKTPLPMPSSGDCWLCCMHDDSGKSWGEHSGNPDHIVSHIKERYLHGSLLANALKWGGYRDPAFMFHHGPRSSIRRVLKRYLYRQCGLVS